MSRVWWILLFLLLVGSVVLELVRPYYLDPQHLWEYPTFYAFYGFAGCAVIVFVSKWIGKYWLQRPVDYYAHHRGPEPVRPAGTEEGENV